MPVRNLLVPINQAQPLALAALLHGIEADPVDRDGNDAYIDLIGSDEKMDQVQAHFPDAVLLDGQSSVPHHEPVFTMVGRTGRDE